MGISDALRSLAGEIDAAVRVLDRINGFYEERFADFGAGSRSRDEAIILSEIFVNLYTCAETAFFRISRHFENSIDDSRWHKEVLHRMTISIPGIRNRVISDDTYRALDELLRFRHFKRYYFEFDYDWDRLELVRKKYLSIRHTLIDDLKTYRDYLIELADESGSSSGDQRE